MYNGYRIKVNGIIFPNRFISKGTFSFVPSERIVNEWEDADLIKTKYVTENKRAIISFSVIEHESGDDHTEIMDILNVDGVVELEYYNDRSDSYETGEFYMSDITFSHLDTPAGKILYGATPILFEER